MNNLSPQLVIAIILCYFGVLLFISWITSRKSDSQSFYLGNKKSPWFLVAFGMIGASLSGITFISIPGWVGSADKQFGYMQMVLGYMVGYVVIAYVLMPLYYRMNLTSIYTYLKQRFGNYSHKVGAIFFLLSRLSGSAIRLLLVANVLQTFLFDALNVSFEVTVVISILLIWVYTFKGGIKTIVWTDTLQTLFMLLSLGLTIWFLANNLDILQTKSTILAVKESQYSQIFFFDNWKGGNHFVKMFLGGIFIAIGMTGLDQDMMQKNLSCKNIKSAQINMMTFSGFILVINLVFLTLGALLFMYANQEGIGIPIDAVTGKPSTDLLFPEIALRSTMAAGVGILFLIGLIAAAYSSADSALTALTTCVCLDFIGNERKEVSNRQRMIVHIAMSIVLFFTVLLFKKTLNLSAIMQLITLAAFTYGPLIGLFFFGILTKRQINDPWVIVVCIIAPVLTYFIDSQSAHWFNGFSFGATTIIINALLTLLGLYIISNKPSKIDAAV